MTIWRRLRDWARPIEAGPSGVVMAEARSHVGTVRTVNEDRFLVCTDQSLWAVADGMGGQGDGMTAAALAISALEDIVQDSNAFGDKDVRHALEHANRMIGKLEKPSGASGATIVVARRDGDEMIIHWAGDSRAYRVSGGTAQLVTKDHSVVQELMDSGLITKTQARDHPQAHVITRALGVNAAIELEIVRVPFRPGDTIVLCSDGLSRSLGKEDLTKHSPSLTHFADRLLQNALRRDGADNVTLVVIQRRI